MNYLTGMILNNLRDKKRIILASQSPRRQELLKGIGIKFSTYVKDDIDESFNTNIPTEQVAEYLAKKKADNYKDILDQNTIIITADTVVIFQNEILNKPKDKTDARRMLNILSGNKHKVITGVCIKSFDKEEVFSSLSTVYFDELSPKEIDYYIDTYKPFDKAGAYGIQEWIGYIGITKIEGSYFNVMGLPVHLIYRKLKLF